MALNLWKIGGMATSYNPLPIGYNRVVIGIGDYTIKFRAKSHSSAYLNVYTFNNSDFSKTIQLTPTIAEFVFTFSIKTSQGFYFNDKDSKGDIIIDNIELVQKPLPKLTINGVDGFKSGKWSLHANTSVISEDTLTLNATANYQDSTLDIPVLGGQQLVLTYEQSQWLVQFLDASSTWLSALNSGNFVASGTTFTVPSNARFVRLLASNGTGRGTFTFKRPMLNLGSIPAPYEKKRGEKMVQPVPKKNLINLSYAKNLSNYVVSSYYCLPIQGVKPNTSYTISYIGGSFLNTKFYVALARVTGYNANEMMFFGHHASSSDNKPTASLVTNSSGKLYLSIYSDNGMSQSELDRFFSIIGDNIQLEEGTTATKFEPYAVQVNKKPAKPIQKAKTGLSFNGVSDYLQLPSMTMDSIEIDCLIDSVQPQTQSLLVDFRGGVTGTDPYISSNNVSTLNHFYINDVEQVTKGLGNVTKNQRVKLKVKQDTPFTDDVTVFGRYTGTVYQTKGTLYKVTCYLNNQIVAQYDFENTANLVGDKIIPQAKNLIPSFEDPRWSLHTSAKVFGKNVLRFEPTSNWQNNDIILDSIPNQPYLFTSNFIGEINLDSIDSVGAVTNTKTLKGLTQSWTFTTPSNSNKIRVRLTNNGNGTGTFDFIKPQLYQLDGKEGTIVGAPQAQNKRSKRSLYAKR